MKKIVRGNDFTLRIPVRKVVNGEQVAFPLPACTDIVVNIVNQYRRVALSYTIDTAEDNIINARVEGDAVSVGTYALEVRGKIFGNDWRSKEYEQFAIVDNNASGDTAFNGELIEGEDSVEMNTALVILPPTAELTQLITDANTAISKANASTEKANAAAVAAEKVDATLANDVLTVTDRNGESTSLQLASNAEVKHLSETMGAYTDRPDIVLTAKETNKAISASGAKVNKSGWAIAEFTAEKGNVYLFKPNVIDESVCIFAEYIQSVETRGIDYTYTYNSDGTTATATATYLGATHIHIHLCRGQELCYY